MFNCQAKVQVQSQVQSQVQKSSPKVKSKSQIQKSSPKVKSKVRSLKSWVQDLDFAYSIITTPHHHPPPTTLNFSDTSRGPTTKCYTFLETSHDPWLRSQLRCKNFANFFATLFCKPTKLTLPEQVPCVLCQPLSRISQLRFWLDNVDSRLVYIFLWKHSSKIIMWKIHNEKSSQLERHQILRF